MRCWAAVNTANMKKKELSKELNKWFKSSNNLKKDFWTRDPVAQIIKNNLLYWGNFKTLGGGDPKKAYRKMQFKLAQNNGFDGDFQG